MFTPLQYRAIKALSAAGPTRFRIFSTSPTTPSIAKTPSTSTKGLRETLQEAIASKQEQLRQLRLHHGDVVLGSSTVDSVVGGLRGVPAILWEGSVVDPIEGIRFRGLTVSDCRKYLSPGPGKEMMPEAMLWLLLTGQVPSSEQIRTLSHELAEKGQLPHTVERIIDDLPRDLHPMTQLGIGVATMNQTSLFQTGYDKGLAKPDYWKHVLEDSLFLIARLPSLAARIYRNINQPDRTLPSIDKSLDLAGNYTRLLGYDGNETLTEYMRLYLAIHADHEGGNVSAHTAHLVNSTLSDPYLSYAASLFALAGPLHGLANQEAVRWQLSLQREEGEDPSYDQVRQYLWKTLRRGHVIPGYGHGVLRCPDPRFLAIKEFCDARPYLQQSSMIRLVDKIFKVAPGVLKEHGKARCPYPNVDANSGCLLYHFGMTEFKYFTVIFGISRALGALTQLVWARALGLPIERPKSYSIDELEKLVKSSKH